MVPLRAFRELSPRSCDVHTYIYLQAPDIVSSYELSIPVSAARYAIRQRFEYNRYVTDPKAIDVLIAKSHMEFQETMNHWKMRDHVLGLLLKPKQRPQKTFMQKFIEGACSLCCIGRSRSRNAQVGTRRLSHPLQAESCRVEHRHYIHCMQSTLPVIRIILPSVRL